MKRKSFVSILLAVCMVLGMLQGAVFADSAENITENIGAEAVLPLAETPEEANENETDYVVKISEVLEKIASSYKSATNEWIVTDMGAYENYAPETENKLTDDAKQKYINSAIDTIVNSSSDTAIDKAVLGLVAIGKNPELLYTVNSNTEISAIEKLNNVTKSTSAWSAPYTLAVYNQGDYDTENYETEIIDTLLANQQENGCWDEWGTIDTTANVIAGLAFYKDRPLVNTAIEKAVGYLSEQQNADGTFSDGYSGPNSNSTAMVVIALCAAGVDLESDTRFIKNDKNIIDGLMSFKVADGNGFGHTDNSSVNPGATEQSFRALIALIQSLKTGEAYNIYDFSKSEFTPARAVSNNASSSAPALPSGNNITVSVTIKADTGYWLKNYSVTIPGDDATVYHAFVKACDSNYITYEGAENGYVSSITKGSNTLAEFDKGENSGWLYKVNGELPTVGLTDCDISDNDVIVWYYTEDWTRDPSAKHYSSGISTTPTKEEEKEEEKETEENKPIANIEEYTDVKAEAWYYNDVKNAIELGLFKGVSENSFAPDESMTRGMLATVLYHYDGEEGFNNKIEFADCEDNKWYSDAVGWASEKGIISGYGNGVFGVDDKITRQQLVTILYKYKGEKTETDLNGFADNAEIETWAKDAMMWAVGNKIIVGTGNQKLSPNGYATRAEIAVILMRFIDMLAQ